MAIQTTDSTSTGRKVKCIWRWCPFNWWIAYPTVLPDIRGQMPTFLRGRNLWILCRKRWENLWLPRAPKLSITLRGVITGFAITAANADEREALWETIELSLSRRLDEHSRFISTLIIDFNRIGFGEFGLGKVPPSERSHLIYGPPHISMITNFGQWWVLP